MTDDDDDALLRVYNKELMALSASTEAPHRLHNPSGAAKAVSPVCGSIVTIELSLKDGAVADFGYVIEACALTKSVVAVMKQAILGKTRKDVARAASELRAMLEEGASPPSGDWAGLKILAPVKDYKARHDTVLLAFEAADKAFEKGSS